MHLGASGAPSVSVCCHFGSFHTAAAALGAPAPLHTAVGTLTTSMSANWRLLLAVAGCRCAWWPHRAGRHLMPPLMWSALMTMMISTTADVSPSRRRPWTLASFAPLLAQHSSHCDGPTLIPFDLSSTMQEGHWAAHCLWWLSASASFVGFQRAAHWLPYLVCLQWFGGTDHGPNLLLL